MSNVSRPLDSSQLKGKRGLRRVLNATRYSLDGLCAAWRNEDAFRQEALAFIFLAPVALLLPLALIEKVALIAAGALFVWLASRVRRIGAPVHPA